MINRAALITLFAAVTIFVNSSFVCQNEYLFYKKATAPAASLNRLDYVFLPNSRGNCSFEPGVISSAVWRQHTAPLPGASPSRTATISRVSPGKHLND